MLTHFFESLKIPSPSEAFRSNFTKKNLKNIFSSYIRYKSAVGVDGINNVQFERALDDHIDLVYQKTRKGNYKFCSYKAKLISKGPLKRPRLISVPTIRDKLVLKALANTLNQSISPHLSRKTLHTIVNEVNSNISDKKFDYYLKLDFKDFYPSIPHDKLLYTIKKRIRKKELIKLLEDSIKTDTVWNGDAVERIDLDRGIPQGLPLSNILADIYLDALDKQFNSKDDIKYFRFVDDLLVFCTEQNNEIVYKELKEAIECFDLNLHPIGSKMNKSSKGHIYVGEDSVSYLGYKFSSERISVREKSIKKMRESILKIISGYKYSEEKNVKRLVRQLNLKVTGCVFGKKNYGWIHYYSQINDKTLLFKLNAFIMKMIKNQLPDEKNLEIKSFVRAWHEINQNRRKTNFIPNYDNYSRDQKLDLIKSEIPTFSDDSDQGIEYLFKKIVFSDIRSLEKDLSNIS